MFTTISYPGAARTLALGLNDSGRIVGYYVDGSSAMHGFIADPTPEPGAFLLMAGGVLALVGCRRWRSRRQTA